jgi:hypothetical protein
MRAPIIVSSMSQTSDSSENCPFLSLHLSGGACNNSNIRIAIRQT